MQRSGSIRCLALGLLAAAAVALAAASSFAEEGKAAPAGPKADKIWGTVTAVDATAKTMTIKGKDKDAEVLWTDATKFAFKEAKAKPEPATATDVKVGSHVSVKCEKLADGKIQALSIWISKGGEHPKAMAHPKAEAPGK
jgi:hypothetical protein